MDSSQIENAIEALWSQTSDSNLKTQALNFTTQLRNEPSAWQPCLELYTKSPQASEQVRNFSLEVITSNVEKGHVDAQGLEYIRAALTSYVQQVYGREATGKSDTPHIQNKLAHALTALFVVLYDSTWPSFFDDFLGLAKDGMSAGGNLSGSVMYFRILGAVHDEIADVLLHRSDEQTKRTVILRDLIRERDATKIATFWQDVLSRWRELDPALLVMCLRTIARWVSWSDISLIINQAVLTSLLEMLGQQAPSSSKVRDAALEAFTAIAAKKMRPAEKIELIKVLNIQTVVEQLIASQALSEYRNTSQYDTDLAENVARLVNHIVRDLVIILDSDAQDNIKQEANTVLQQFVPLLLRFFTDEFDEVCNTVVDGLSDILSFLRKHSKDGPNKTLPQEYSALLPSILHAIINKMKFDETTSYGEEGEEEEEAEFVELRRRLQPLQSQVTAIDENLVLMTVSELVQQTFRRYAANEAIEWIDLELALYQMYLFGEVAQKQAGKPKPAKHSPANEQLGAMVVEMMESKIGRYEHPAVQLQFMDNVTRYSKFFEQNTQYIPPALEALVTYAHSGNSRVRLLAWYNFQRFTRTLRGHLGEVSQSVIQAIADLLPIKASLPGDREDDDEDSSSDISSYYDAVFNSQLYLFEAIGCLSSSSLLPVETKLLYIRSIIDPIFADMQQNLEAAKSGDERSVMQIHHDIMALGSLSHGYTDWVPGSKERLGPPSEITEQFTRCGEAILVALESLNSVIFIRQASQNSLARLIGGMGNTVLPQLPRWIDGLLSQSSTKEETATFLHLLTQIIFAFKSDISSVLDAVLSPLLQRVFQRLSEVASGTDDEMQLGDLRRKFLSFLSMLLGHDLGSILVSANNQTAFENIITAVEHFARDASDLATARTAFTLLIRMTQTWGGPDIMPIPSSTPNPSTTTPSAPVAVPPNSPTSLSPSPLLPGFDSFIITRFSPLSWSIPSTPGFKPRDAQARLVVHEIAALQQEILKKTGEAYLQSLRFELQSMGLGREDVEVYLGKLKGEQKGFKEFLTSFLARAAGGGS